MTTIEWTMVFSKAVLPKIIQEKVNRTMIDMSNRIMATNRTKATNRKTITSSTKVMDNKKISIANNLE